MLNRIIRMAAAVAGCIVLAGGCSRTTTLTPERSEICFGAGTALLQNDANPTKSGTLKTGTAFSTDDAFLAWAWHDAANQYLRFGTSQAVTLGSNGLWDYAPHQFWNWQGAGDFYDFLAIYPADADISPFEATLGNSNLKATVTYVPTETQYDLMAAGLRRTDGSTGPVDLSFSHALSAVSVNVKNAEGSNRNGTPLTITLKSVSFVNLIGSYSLTVTFNGTNLAYGGSGDRNTVSAILGPAIPANTYLAPGYGYPSQRIATDLTTWIGTNTSLDETEKLALVADICKDEVWNMLAEDFETWIAQKNDALPEGHKLTSQQISDLWGQIYRVDEWDLMIPQNLNPGSQNPALQIVYNMGEENDVTETLPLKDIKNVSNVPITAWNPGIKYHYEIELRIGVGIVVTVTTTPWEVVEAETPGLMIS